jgi:HAD superfamily hydrolase (TIGR01509 family)
MDRRSWRATDSVGRSRWRQAMEQLEALIWDMDGTLIDSGTVVPDAFIATVQALGGTTYTREQVIDLYPLGPPAIMLTRLLGRPYTAADLDEYHRRLRATASMIAPYPGIADVLARLHGRLPMAVFTGASSQAARLLLEATGLLEHFAVVVAGDQVDRQKPHPDGILRACQLLGVSAQAAAYVADAPIDLEAARRAGALPVAAGWGHLHRASAPASVVLEQPGELLELLRVA